MLLEAEQEREWRWARRWCVEHVGELRTNKSETNGGDKDHGYCLFLQLVMMFETMRNQSSGFFIFRLHILLSKQGSPRTAIASSTRGIEVANSNISRENAREMSSSSAPVWYIIGMVGREGNAAG